MKCHQCQKNVKENVDSSEVCLRDGTPAFFCSEQCFCAYAQKPFVPYNERDGLFHHVQQYPSFAEFRKAVLRCLNHKSWGELVSYEFDRFLAQDYGEWQNTQLEAVNKVLSELYGEKVKYFYVAWNDENNEDSNGEYGPYIEINEKKTSLMFNHNDSLDSFIRSNISIET